MSDWQKTRTQYFIKHVSSGNYYVRKRIGDQMRRACLKTSSEEIARLRLPAKLTEMQAQWGGPSREVHKATMSECIGAYRAKVVADTSIKPRSRDFRLETLKMLDKTWPVLGQMPCRKVVLKDVQAWARRADEHYGATRFNALLDTLRAIFDVAVNLGGCRKFFSVKCFSILK